MIPRKLHPLIPVGGLAKWGDIIVEVEAVSFQNGERVYLACDANGTVIYAPDGDLTPYSLTQEKP